VLFVKLPLILSTRNFSVNK